jgi:hypothetical protein
MSALHAALALMLVPLALSPKVTANTSLTLTLASPVALAQLLALLAPLWKNNQKPTKRREVEHSASCRFSVKITPFLRFYTPSLERRAYAKGYFSCPR